MRRLIAGLLVCLTVFLSSCSPVMAASTTDSQIMFSKDSDSGIAPMSLDDGLYKTMIFCDLYNSYDFSFLDDLNRAFFVDGNQSSFDPVSSGSFSYLTSISGYDSALFDSFVVQDGYVYAVAEFNYYSNVSSTTDYLLRPGDKLSARLGGFALQFSCQSPSGVTQVLSPLFFSFDHAEAVYYPFGAGDKRSVPLSGVSVVPYSSSFPDWSVVSFDSYVPFTCSSVSFRFYFKFSLDDLKSFLSLHDASFLNLSFMFGYEDVIDSNLFLEVVPGTTTGNDTDQVVGGLNSVNSSIHNLNSSIQSMIGDVKALGSALAQQTQAIQQQTAQLLSKLEQVTQSLSAVVELQLQSIREQLGLVKDSVTSGFTSVSTSILNQTTQITGKIDSLQQNVTNKLDTVNTSITDLMDETKQGFTDVKKGITDLPGKMGEMLQGLIVPDSEKVSGKFEEFNSLAEEKLGVIYQVPDMVISMGQSVVSGAVEQKGEMTLPKFEIIMPATNQSRAGERLTVWEEYTFPIWPEGTEVIHTAVQTATSLVCVIAMINSIKRKYEDWLDGK